MHLRLSCPVCHKDVRSATDTSRKERELFGEEECVYFQHIQFADTKTRALSQSSRRNSVDQTVHLSLATRKPEEAL